MNTNVMHEESMTIGDWSGGGKRLIFKSTSTGSHRGQSCDDNFELKIDLNRHHQFTFIGTS